MNAERGEVVVGRNPVVEAIKSGRARHVYVSDTAQEDRTMRALVARAESAGVPVERVPAARIERMAAGTNHQGVAAQCGPRTSWSLDEIVSHARGRGEDPFLILLDGVEDPHNLGAVLRVADGAGAHGVVIPSRGAVHLTPTVFKASAGAAEHVPIVEVGNLTDAVIALKRHEVWVGVAEASTGKPYYAERLTGPLALVLGSEGWGVSRPVAKHADFATHIPLLGAVSSLNVSVACAVLAFERARQKARQGHPPSG